MAISPQGFQRRLKDHLAPERPTVNFFLEMTDEDEDGNEYVVRRDDFTATRPTDDQLMLIFAAGGNENAGPGDEANAILNFFRDSLPPDQYRLLVKRLHDPNDEGVDSEIIGEVFQWLMEQWQDFPTRQRGGSSSSPRTTGPRSTGRVRGKGSTR